MTTGLPPVVVGEPGEPGEPGKPFGHGGKGGKGGKGGVGLTGPEGAPAGWSDRAVMFLVAVLTVVFAFFYVRVTVAQGDAERARWESCVAGQAIIVGYNDQQDQLARAEEANPDLDMRETLQRIYRDGKFPVGDCGSNPAE